MPRYWSVLLASFALNLLIVPVIWNDHLRFTYKQTLAHWLSKVKHPHTVYLGDSVTAGGRDFGDPTSINLATSGLQTYQIAAAIEGASTYSPERIVVMAGTNDAIEGPIDAEELVSLWQDICGDQRIVVVLAPPTSDPVTTERVDLINSIARRTCLGADREVLSLDELQGENGLILPRYTVDGVHLNDAAYAIWRSHLERAGI